MADGTTLHITASSSSQPSICPLRPATSELSPTHDTRSLAGADGIHGVGDRGGGEEGAARRGPGDGAGHRHRHAGQLRLPGRLPGLLLQDHQERAPRRPQGEVQEDVRQVADPEAVHAPDGGDPDGEPEHVRVHGAVAGRAAGHRGGGGPEAREGGGAEGDQGVGPAAVQDHAPRLLHHLRRRHAGRRLPAHQDAGPAPVGEALHDVPAGLLRRRHGAAHGQGPRREQPRRARSGGLLRDHRRHLPRPARVAPRLAGRPGALRRRRGGGHRRLRPRRVRRAAAVPDGVGEPDHPAGLGGRHRRPPPGGGAHLPPAQGRARAHLQEHRARARGGLRAARHRRLELHLLDRAPRRPGHPRHGGGQGGPRQGPDAGHPRGPLRVRQHVQRLRPLHPRRDAQALRRGRPGHHRRGHGLGRPLRLRPRPHRRDRRPPQRPHHRRRNRMIKSAPRLFEITTAAAAPPQRLYLRGL